MKQRRIVDQVARAYRNRVMECRLQALLPRQEDLAQLTGISRSTISALENQRLFLSAHYALVIAEALHCRLDDLYEKCETTYRQPGYDSR